MSENKGSIEGGFLDISTVPNDDQDKLAACIEGFYKTDSTVKTRLSYNWDRNHRFIDGDQWLAFDGDRESGGQWRRLAVSKANEYIPRPVTNYIYDVYQTLKSYVIKNKPHTYVRPNTNRNKDKQAAKIAELILECNYEALGEQANYEYAASCLLAYGTVFKKDYWDNTAVATVRVPKMVQSPIMDANTQAPMVGPDGLPQMEETQELDEMGEPAFDVLPLGDVNTEVCEPYRIALDPLATDLHKAKWIMEYSIQSLNWIKETYGKNDPGYTGKVEEVKEEKSLSGSMRRFAQLKNSSGVRGAQGGEGSGGTSGGDISLTNSAVVKEYYERPSLSFPKGRMVIVANNVVLYAGESPYSGPDLGDWHPYSECRWEIVPGRFWGKSPLDSGVEIQKQINSIDSVIILTRKTMAVPQKLLPAGCGIAKGQWTGRPGQELEYRDQGGAKPELLPAVGVDAQVFQEREQRLEDLKNITGAIDILKGDRPPGVTAASALNLLYEVGTGKLFPILDRWKKFIEISQKKQLKLIATKYKEPRPEFIKRMMSKNSSLDPGALEKFIGTDLYDNCNVIVEAGSNVPKLQAAKQAQLMESAQVGTLSLESPSNRMEFNRQMGITGFDNDIEPDVERAQWENDLLDDIELSPDNRPMVLAVDEDAIHMEVLARRMKEPSFMSASGTVQQAYMMHYQEHMDAKAQKDQAKMMESMANGVPPGEQQSANDKQQVQGHGGGAPSQAKDALFRDTKIPGENA